MPWIDDVVPYTTILSTWGNRVRDRVIADVASVAERDAKITAPHDGQAVWCAAEQVLFVRVLNQWQVAHMEWRAYTGGMWWGNATGPTKALAGVDILWRNNFGRCEASGVMNSTTTEGGPATGFWFRIPIPSLQSGDMGEAVIYGVSTGLLYGGRGVYGGVISGGPPVCNVNNVGPGVAPTPTVSNITAGVSVGFSIAYPCDARLYQAV